MNKKIKLKKQPTSEINLSAVLLTLTLFSLLFFFSFNIETTSAAKDCSCADILTIGQTCQNSFGETCFGAQPKPANTCGNDIVESGEECDFNSAFGPYPNQCPGNGPCDQATCKCDTGNQNSGSNTDSECTPTCACAAETYIGDFCEDDICEGTVCQGEKTPQVYDNKGLVYDSQDKATCYSSPNNPVSPSVKTAYHYLTMPWWFRDYSDISLHIDPNTGLLKESCDEDKETYWCQTQDDGRVIRRIYAHYLLKNAGCGYSKPCWGECVYSFDFYDMDVRIFIPPGTITFDISETQVLEGYLAVSARHNQIPSFDVRISGDKVSLGLAAEGCPPENNWGNYSDYYDAPGGLLLGEIVRKKKELCGIGGSQNWGAGGFLKNPITLSEAGWLYLTQNIYDGAGSGAAGLSFILQVDPKIFNEWFANYGSDPSGSINWEKDVESVTTYSAIDPDCDQKTCTGNSCWNGEKYIPGTKTEGCATGEAKATPDRLTKPGESFITWSSQGASEMGVDCEGAVSMERGDDWYLSGEECYDAGQYCQLNGTEKGYPLTLGEDFFKQSEKQEICTFYPTNKSDGRPGTPFSFIINLGEEEDGEEERTNSGYTCQPDDPACAKSTCKDVRCFDGCEYLQGTKNCQGRE